MSRFAESDGWDDPEDERAFDQELAAQYKLASDDLRGFLAHLDAMPVKRIIADRFVKPASGEACAVAEFCRFKGVDRKELLEAEAESRLQRIANEGPEDSDGWDGPTVGMGVKAGLPEYVAFNLAWKNDEVWDQIEDGVEHVPGVKGRFEGNRLVPDEENGTLWIQRPYDRKLYRKMTPEERWLRLRNHVAKRIGEPTIEATPA